jgi:DHA3 family tetracycline resistance protein-like MFS transporter
MGEEVRRADARRLYYSLELLTAMPGWVVVDLYLVRTLHFSPLELILVGSATEAAIVVGEIPTGVVADTYSRRLSVIIGLVGMGASVVLIGVTSTPWLVIVLWGLWGLAATFQSGAYEAWIADEVGVEDMGSVFLRGARMRYLGSMLGLCACVAFGLVSLRATVVAGGVLELGCGLACILLMPEAGFRRRRHPARRRVPRELWATAGDGVRFVRGNRVVLLLVATALFAGAGAVALDRLPEAHVLRDVSVPGSIDPVIAFGAVAGVTMLFAFFAIGPAIRRVDRGGGRAVARLLVLFTVATIAAQIAFALGMTFAFVMGAWVAALVARSLVPPLYTTWLNKQISDSSVRATVLSISGQARGIGQAAGGPAVGIVGNVVGIPAALVTGALTGLPAVGLYVRALRRGGVEPELAPA